MKTESVFEQKRALEEQIDITIAGISRLPNLTSLQIELNDWNLRLTSLMNQYDNNLGRVIEVRRADYFQIKGKIDELRSNLKNLREIESKTRAEHAKLTEELAALDLRVTLKELVSLQEKVTDAEKIVGILNGAIASERKKIDGDEHSNNQALAALTEERENLLADLASGGQVDEGRLKQIEKQIAVEESKHEKHVDSIITASHTVAGLNRKIVTAEDELSVDKKNLNNAAVSFIKAEIDQAGLVYIDLASKLSDTYMRIISLAVLCEKLGTPVNVFGPYTYQVKIPSFALDVCLPHECPDMAGMLFRYAGFNVQNFIKVEIERLESLGLKLPL